MTRTLTLSAYASIIALALAFSGPALAQTYEDWDTDEQEGITQQEWTERFGGIGAYDNWDTDNDGVVSQQEFNEGVFRAYDEDGDGVIYDEEFGSYAEHQEQGFWER
jgi:hypothetical protein